MILVNNPWGESNEKGLTAALAAKGMKAVGVEKFEANDLDVVPQLTRLKDSGADVLFLVGNVGPSAQVVKSLDRMGWKVPIVSHWGPAGGRFTELAGPSAKSVHFVQTYSFFGKQSPVGDKVMKALIAKYPDIKGPDDVTPAVGVANAYDATMLAALAIALAGSTDGDAIRQAFYKIDKYDGLIKVYTKPFSTDDARRAGRERLRVGAVHRQPHPAGRRDQLTMLTAALVSGLGLGSMYGLMAMGFYVTYAVSGTVNFAQGSSMMLGAVLTYAFAQALGWPMLAVHRARAGFVRAVRTASSRSSRCGRSCGAVRTPG